MLVMLTNLSKYHAAGQWEKVLKHCDYLQQILDITSDDEMGLHKNRLPILAIFIYAYKEGIASDNILRGRHALTLCHLLSHCIVSHIKLNDNEAVGRSMCDMASFAQIVPAEQLPPGRDPIPIEFHFNGALQLGRTRGISSVVAQACLGLGQLSLESGEMDAAERLFKEAFVAASKVKHEHETHACLLLADLYFVKGKVEKADWFVQRTSCLLQEDQYGLYKLFTPMHLANQLQKIRIHEAKGETPHVAVGLGKFVKLVHLNVVDVAKWKLMLQIIILHSFGHLRTLDKSNGDPFLKKMMTNLADCCGISPEDVYLPPHRKLPRIKYV